MSSPLRRVPALRCASALADAVTEAFTTKGSLDYWAAARHAVAAGDLAEELAALVRLGRARDAIEALAQAIGLLLSTLDDADDTSGALDDLLNRLLATHAVAAGNAHRPV